MGIVCHLRISDWTGRVTIAIPVDRVSLDAITSFSGISFTKPVCTSCRSTDNYDVIFIPPVLQDGITLFLQQIIVCEVTGSSNNDFKICSFHISSFYLTDFALSHHLRRHLLIISAFVAELIPGVLWAISFHTSRNEV